VLGGSDHLFTVASRDQATPAKHQCLVSSNVENELNYLILTIPTFPCLDDPIILI
jgi:hypothetical protein